MTRFLLRRLALIPLALVIVNFIGFAYAHISLRYQQAQNPFGSDALENAPPVLTLYVEYARGLLQGDSGAMPVGAGESVAAAVGRAAGASVGLLALVFTLSLILGLGLGLWAVRVNPGRVSPWLLPPATIGLSLPSFYIGILFVVASVYYVLRGGEGVKPPFPLQGFGWDIHLVLPVLALLLRPTVQIAQVTAGLLSDELNRQYVVAARSRGNTWRRAQWRHALSNVLAPVLLAMASSFRLLVGELILVEWLFVWPGLGHLLAQTLVPPNIASPASLSGHTIYFLHPPLVAALLTGFTLVFLVLDVVTSFAVRSVDPRLRAEAAHG
jgi:peptide/nickel transport system permease protein